MLTRYERGGKGSYVTMAAAAAMALTVSKAIEHDSKSKNISPKQIGATLIEQTPHISYVEVSDTLTIAKKRRHHHLTPAQIAAKEVTPAEFAAWSKVNVCEEGGDWHVSGSTYSGGLGISNANWISYGGQFFSNSAATATPDEQIVVAMRIQKDPPDQNGCAGSW